MVLVPKMAAPPVGAEITTPNVSFTSARLSSIIPTVTVLFVSLGKKVIEPLVLT